MNSPLVPYVQYGVPVLGAGVLGTYAYGLTRKVDKGRFWGGLRQKKLKMFWGLTAILTAVSFLYLYWLFGFGLEDQTDRTYYQLLVVGYVIFFLGALFWMPHTVDHLRKPTGTKRSLIRMDLWLTSIGSGFILYSSTHLPGEESEWKKNLALSSGILMLVQHIFWDAIIWDSTF